MELKQAQRKSWPLIAAAKALYEKPLRFWGVLMYTFLVFAFGVYVVKSGFLGRTLTPLVSRDIPILMPKRIQAAWLKPDVEHLIIDIKHEDFMKLAYQRELALSRGVLLAEEKEFVPATIRYNDEATKVRIRLKGDRTDHLRGDKWSFRIRVKGDDTLFSMKQFSIQHPGTRNYVYEWLFHRALKREGVLSLRYEFINVTLNGKNLGVYALEEHFEKRLIEYNQLREGPIVRFTEDFFWEEVRQQYRTFPGAERNGSGSYLSSDIDAFQTSKLLADPTSYDQYLKAVHLLESVRRGELKISEVLDIHKFATYVAVNDLMGAQHSSDWTNVRFYYNPVTSRLEPIGFDGNSGETIETLTARRNPVIFYTNKFYETVFSDPIFLEEYVRELERISEPSYLDALLAELDDELEQNLHIIHSEFPEFDFSKEVFYENQDYIRTVLNPVKGLHAYFSEASENQIELQLGNTQGMPLELLGVSYQDTRLFRSVQKTILSAKSPQDLVDYQVVGFVLPEDIVWDDSMVQDLRVEYRLLGTSRVRQETVFPWSFLDENFVENDFIRQEPNFRAFDFLVTDEATQVIFIKPGSWQLDQSMIIPAGYRVIAGAGTELDLSNGATILSYSPLELVGSEDAPIVVQSSEGSGQGLVVMNAGEASVLEYVIFNNLGNPAQNGWELTGAVTFYELPVQISQTQFVGNRSEDGLNIIRSEFTIERSLFSETSSDAFDADFTTGQVTQTLFEGIGNDAIDASGSVIELADISIKGAGDKGVSIGENSQMTVKGLEIENAEIAVASKDLSELTLAQVTITGGEIGLTAYQKKSEFGGATIDARDLVMSQVAVPYLVEEQSTVVVDNKVIEASRENVEDILYGVEYGKE